MPYDHLLNQSRRPSPQAYWPSIGSRRKATSSSAQSWSPQGIRPGDGGQHHPSGFRGVDVLSRSFRLVDTGTDTAMDRMGIGAGAGNGGL